MIVVGVIPDETSPTAVTLSLFCLYWIEALNMRGGGVTCSKCPELELNTTFMFYRLSWTESHADLVISAYPDKKIICTSTCVWNLDGDDGVLEGRSDHTTQHGGWQRVKALIRNYWRSWGVTMYNGFFTGSERIIATCAAMLESIYEFWSLFCPY